MSDRSRDLHSIRETGACAGERVAATVIGGAIDGSMKFESTEDVATFAMDVLSLGFRALQREGATEAEIQAWEDGATRGFVDRVARFRVGPVSRLIH